MARWMHLKPPTPARHCPQCARAGVRSKVKKFRVDKDKEELTIMCKNIEVGLNYFKIININI